MFDSQRAGQDDGDLLKLGPLSEFDPAGRRFHSGDADVVVARIHAADELFDLLRLVAGSGDPRRLLNEMGHAVVRPGKPSG